MTKDKTMILTKEEFLDERIKICLCDVINALDEKGYSPVAQISGYIISGDPAYITNHKKARTKIAQFSSQEIAEFFIKNYLKAR